MEKSVSIHTFLRLESKDKASIKNDKLFITSPDTFGKGSEYSFATQLVKSLWMRMYEGSVKTFIICITVSQGLLGKTSVKKGFADTRYASWTEGAKGLSGAFALRLFLFETIPPPDKWDYLHHVGCYRFKNVSSTKMPAPLVWAQLPRQKEIFCLQLTPAPPNSRISDGRRCFPLMERCPHQGSCQQSCISDGVWSFLHPLST